MIRPVRNQLEHEYNSWKRKLEFFKQENALLKYRLSEMVDSYEGANFLQMAEYFQNELLLKDEGLKKLTTSVQEFVNEAEEVSNQERHEEELIAKQQDLRKKILKFEKTFLSLSNEFNEKMLKIPEH